MPSNAGCVGHNAAVLVGPNRALRCVKQSLVPGYISTFIIIIIIMCIIYNIFRHRSSDPLRINSITTDTVCTEKETLKGGLRR